MVKEEKSLTAFVLGILSLIFWFIPLFGLPISIVGLVLGIKGIKANKKLAMAALICSIIGLTLAIANAAVGAYMGATGQHALVNQIFG